VLAEELNVLLLADLLQEACDAIDMLARIGLPKGCPKRPSPPVRSPGDRSAH
jgi:hypothetical protein